MSDDPDGLVKLGQSLRDSIARGPEKFVQQFSFEGIYGYCPVQAYGKINGKKWYYRSRHGEWSIDIDGGEIASGEDDGDGWTPLHEAVRLIVDELLKYAEAAK